MTYKIPVVAVAFWVYGTGPLPLLPDVVAYTVCHNCLPEFEERHLGRINEHPSGLGGVELVDTAFGVCAECGRTFCDAGRTIEGLGPL